MINIKEYYECECTCSVIKVWHDKDTDYVDDTVFVSIYKNHRGWSIIHKLHLIWHIIKTGEPYSDEVVLSLDDARRLGKDLLKELGKK